MLHVMCHVSRHVSCHVSRVTCHMSHVNFFFFFFFGQSGEAYRWRVCYQRGLPRLVLLQEYFFFKVPFPTSIPCAYFMKNHSRLLFKYLTLSIIIKIKQMRGGPVDPSRKALVILEAQDY